jgi:hypothetical protein
MEFTRRLSRSSSINDNDIASITDTQIDINTVRSYPKHEMPILRTKTSIVNSNGNFKKSFSQKLHNYVVQQPLSSIESVLRERSISIAQENPNQSDTIERPNQLLKKQLYLPFEKTKRL